MVARGALFVGLPTRCLAIFASLFSARIPHQILPESAQGKKTLEQRVMWQINNTPPYTLILRHDRHHRSLHRSLRPPPAHPAACRLLGTARYMHLRNATHPQAQICKFSEAPSRNAFVKCRRISQIYCQSRKQNPHPIVTPNNGQIISPHYWYNLHPNMTCVMRYCHG